jgi:hypothetical protein
MNGIQEKQGKKKKERKKKKNRHVRDDLSGF